MGLKTFRPTSPGFRQRTVLTYDEITKTDPEKSLIVRISRCGGRNNVGRITARHRGGGAKKMYRMVDFKMTGKINIGGIVKAVEFDPNRTAFIMLVQYKDGQKKYHLAPDGIKVGAKIEIRPKAKVRKGNRMMLKNIPIGYPIHNVEMQPGKGGQMGRTAGAIIRLVSLEGNLAQLQLPSGEIRLAAKECYASIGTVSNLEHNNVSLGKAGRKRHMGRRPHVRGKAMNPCDHPHGGGEGCTPIGLPGPETPWGMPTLGYKTRRRKNNTNKMIVKRRK